MNEFRFSQIVLIHVWTRTSRVQSEYFDKPDIKENFSYNIESILSTDQVYYLLLSCFICFIY